MLATKVAFGLFSNAYFSDGFDCLIMTKPREARQSWPEIRTIEKAQSFVIGGEVWHKVIVIDIVIVIVIVICIEVWDAVRLPQNTKSSLVIQRVALEGITNAKVNSLNQKKSRISVRFC